WSALRSKSCVIGIHLNGSSPGTSGGQRSSPRHHATYTVVAHFSCRAMNRPVTTFSDDRLRRAFYLLECRACSETSRVATDKVGTLTGSHEAGLALGNRCPKSKRCARRSHRPTHRAGKGTA